MKLLLILVAAALWGCKSEPKPYIETRPGWVSVTLENKSDWIAVREFVFSDADGKPVKPVAASASGVYADMRELPAWGGIEAALDNNFLTAWNAGDYKATVRFQFAENKPASVHVAMVAVAHPTEITGSGFKPSGVISVVLSADEILTLQGWSGKP